MRSKILSLVKNIDPFDELEAEHRLKALKWIDSDKKLFRTQKPAIPDPHLVSYFVLYDSVAKKILLVDHKKAQLWLPSGGHVESNEHPKTTVERECIEELSITADFLFDEPIFITITKTVGLTAGHTDVSLWYVLKADSEKQVNFDQDEFQAVKWFSLGQLPDQNTEPYLARFESKLNLYL